MSHQEHTGSLEAAFTFDFTSYEDLEPGQRWSAWPDLEPLMKGPEPRPDWLVTSAGAIDTDLGVLKTGKEADVHLVQRRDPHADDEGVVMAAKRYRSSQHSSFTRSSVYVEGRSVKRSRDERALKRKSTWGRVVAAGEWANAEWAALNRCWSLGLPVPYPVQIDGTEILMEWISHDGATAPRLAQTRPERDLLESWFDQIREVLHQLAGDGVVHGDLSPYNVLAAGERLVVIDLPQMVDLAGNPQAAEFLLRDCTNLCTWFRARGLEVDEHDLFADVLAHAY
ncbi:MAG: serine protein kinase RIO [Nocardioides sp.]|uniref:serine protein kinase RIO n=1 Tax=Nocardioides sp. TaxID=35761 RepID=UPI003F00A3EE